MAGETSQSIPVLIAKQKTTLSFLDFLFTNELIRFGDTNFTSWVDSLCPEGKPIEKINQALKSRFFSFSASTKTQIVNFVHPPHDPNKTYESFDPAAMFSTSLYTLSQIWILKEMAQEGIKSEVQITFAGALINLCDHLLIPRKFEEESIVLTPRRLFSIIKGDFFVTRGPSILKERIFVHINSYIMHEIIEGLKNNIQRNPMDPTWQAEMEALFEQSNMISRPRFLEKDPQALYAGINLMSFVESLEPFIIKVTNSIGISGDDWI